jgi:uncharacterized membrane protein
MDRHWADRLAVGTVAAVLLIGVAWAWNAARQPTMDGTMMGSMMDGGMGYGTDPLSALLGGFLLAVVLGAGYLLVREQITEPEPNESDTAGAHSRAGESTAAGATVSDEHRSVADEDGETESAAKAEPEREAPESPEGETLLRYLPEDEQRVLKPVIESPGVTQIEIRDRSGFSKSKVSQTLSDLEERGLVAREKQGRTYRVSPGAELAAESGPDR